MKICADMGNVAQKISFLASPSVKCRKGLKLIVE